MAVVIKTFATPGGKYVFDRETNALLSVSDEEFAAFGRIENQEDNDNDWELLKRYTVQGYLQESKLRKIEHGVTPYLRHQLNSQISQLTLCVTQNCNLRCSYCTYGGNYNYQRPHSDKIMSLDTMKKSVDFIMARSRGLSKVSLGFYGGEPLLAIENIKACVAYVKDKYKGKQVYYTITTNGTVFNDDIICFLHENEINVSISIDGPRDIHNRNRVFEDGSPSFDKIMTNMEYIKEHYPDFFKQISFFTVVAPGADFSCVNEFFNASDVMADNMVSQRIVNSYDAKEDVLYDDMYGLTYGYQHMRVLLAALDMYTKSKLSKLFITNITNTERFYERLSKREMYEADHPGGPCVPGVMRPFVSIDGSIFPCERVNEGSAAMKIGHIDTGIDLEKAEAVLNVGKLSEDECISCWNFHHCGLCAAGCDGGNALSKEIRLNNCAEQMNNTGETLETVCLLLENGYDFSRTFAIEEVENG